MFLILLLIVFNRVSELDVGLGDDLELGCDLFEGWGDLEPSGCDGAVGVIEFKVRQGYHCVIVDRHYLGQLSVVFIS